MSLYEFHDDAVAIEVVGLGDGEAAVVQGLHVGELFRSRNARKVNPETIKILTIKTMFAQSIH
jgi:hypothetical protein